MGVMVKGVETALGMSGHGYLPRPGIVRILKRRRFEKVGAAGSLIVFTRDILVVPKVVGRS